MKANELPNDADGDVLRRLLAKGLDFSKVYLVDFNVDFNPWPPPAKAIQVLQTEFPGAEIHQDEDGNNGYVLFKLKSILSYDLVIKTQAKATNLVSQYGGCCESWGVLHD